MKNQQQSKEIENSGSFFPWKSGKKVAISEKTKTNANSLKKIGTTKKRNFF